MNGQAQWLAPNFDNIPEELHAQPWAVWIAEPRAGNPGKFNKAPRDPTTGRKVGTDKPHLFGTFAEAKAAYVTGRFTGVGVLLTGNGIIGVDIDDYKMTLKDLPKVKTWVAEALHAGAYCEYSPSKTGLRLFMRGKLPERGRKHDRLEIYDNQRFLTVTGGVLEFDKSDASCTR